MTVIIDYDMGNVGSIFNMLQKVGGECVISRDNETIHKAEKLILPGVGSFDTGIGNIDNFGLRSVLDQKVLVEKTPILGVCLGMQILTRGSEEGVLRGLGWINGRTVKFPRIVSDNNKLRIPHMGWNYTEVKKDDPLFANMHQQPRFYFVHSYYVICANPEDILAETKYGINFTSCLSRGNIWGTQCHPEKSHKYGMKIFHNFVHNI